MGRKRRYHKDRPDNVKVWRDTESGQSFYKYVFPDGRTRGLGSDRAQAFSVADALNTHFEADKVKQALKPRASRQNPKFGDAVELFIEKWLRHKKYSKRTRSEKRIKLDSYKRQWLNKTVREFEVTDLSNFLNDTPPNSYPKHRTLLVHLFQFFTSQGWIEENQAERTMFCAETPEKVRQRMDEAGFWKIYDANTTPAWLKRAMRMGLYTLQRNGDLVAMKRSDVVEDRAIRVLQRKSRNYKDPVFIEIQLEGDALATLKECLKSDIPCPYLIHYRPLRMTSRKKMSRLHPFQVTEGKLSEAFSRARDACGAYAELKPRQRPSFHEIRSLGEKLYKDRGFSSEYVMALAGWADGEHDAALRARA